MIAPWLAGNALSFDLETTSADPETARIVTATCVEVGALGVVRRENWLVNPGVPIPAEATAIHGVTDLMAAGGLSPADAVPAIVGVLRNAWNRGLPVIAMNAPYDLTVLACEWLRLNYDHPLDPPGPVLDPLVIDRGIDPYREGRRTLTALAAHYGCRQDGAHTSEGDAMAAARIVWKMAKTIWPLSKHTLEQLQVWQAEAHAKWAVNYQNYLAAQGKPATIDGSWPVRRAA